MLIIIVAREKMALIPGGGGFLHYMRLTGFCCQKFGSERLTVPDFHLLDTASIQSFLLLRGTNFQKQSYTINFRFVWFLNYYFCIVFAPLG